MKLHNKKKYKIKILIWNYYKIQISNKNLIINFNKLYNKKFKVNKIY